MFDEWFRKLDEVEQDAILEDLRVLEAFGPTLGRPWVDTINGTTLKNLKEPRIRHTGEPIRILFAFDPWQQAILLVGGNKAGDKNWYKKNVPIAQKRFNQYIEAVKDEGKNA